MSARGTLKIKTDGLPGLHDYAELLVKAALAEDIGSGDITTGAIVSKTAKGEAEIIAREDMVVAGLFIAEKTFKLLDRRSVFHPNFKDGHAVKKGSVMATVSGRLSALLTGERVALNFLQRLSGISSMTREFIRRIDNPEVKLLDTRKTTPCLRVLEKYAVKAGGGYNHRFGLFDAVLIKDNHIAAAGGVKPAVGRVLKRYRDSVPIEVEVTNFKEVREAVEAGADIIMLDNMDAAKIRKSLKMIKNMALVEVSGGVTLANVRDIAATGVDFISVGALTHSAPSVDISMEVVSYAGKRGRRS
ncbi:MAG: carboxylating nicotinate-nucleotide diphosphorylase [Deltaproteobacteria bacterium]|nr:carboxylating nicotinate-nucleotide diphosphorylase [Deltaproteobacteria bacterium]